MHTQIDTNKNNTLLCTLLASKVINAKSFSLDIQPKCLNPLKGRGVNWLQFAIQV